MLASNWYQVESQKVDILWHAELKHRSVNAPGLQQEEKILSGDGRMQFHLGSGVDVLL